MSPPLSTLRCRYWSSAPGRERRRGTYCSLPCAPKDVNHKEFYHECKPPCYYFVTKDYGHLDMLDDDAPKFMTCMCKDGKN